MAAGRAMNTHWQVITHPFFDGTEEVHGMRWTVQIAQIVQPSTAIRFECFEVEVYLRAQIARIAADTVLCPKGFLKKAWTQYA